MSAEKNTDKRLLAAYTALDSGLIKILSLDIFDTLVWRQLPEPEDLFLLLGRRLKEQGWLVSAVTEESFAQLRIEAERMARLEKEAAFGTSEITLPEIYWRLPGPFTKLSLEQMLSGTVKGIYESDVSELVAMELSLEKELLQPDINCIRLIEYAKSKNIAVILVSNTYFDEQQIRYLLGDAVLDLVQSLYLSCEFGCSKQNGLFEHMLREQNILASAVLHIGDNLDSDILPAAEQGIKTLHYLKRDAKFQDIVEREWPEDFSQRKQMLDSNSGDFGLTAFRAKVTHRITSVDLGQEERFFWLYGATVLGPILTGFVHWIYARCHDMQQSKVFCLMREGKLYAQLIKRFAPYYPEHAVQPQLLWVSRLFIVHASMATANRQELVAITNVFLEHFTVETVCNYLGVDIKKLGKWSPCRHMMLDNSALRHEFIFYLISQEPLRQQIIQNAQAKRKRFLNYLSTLMDLSEKGQMTLVDVGWRGTAQGALRQILQLAHSPIRLHGLYLGTTQASFPAFLNDDVREGFLFQGGYPDCGNVHMKGCFVLEQTATAETGFGSLQDIDNEGNIVTAPFYIPEKQKKQAGFVQQGIFAFLDYIAPYIRSKAIKWDSKSPALQHQLRSIFLRSMMNTTHAEATKFGSWLHEHGPTSKLTQVIGKNSYYEQYIKDMLPVAAFKESGLNWPAAYAARHSKYLTLASQAIWMNTLPPQCFLSEDTFPLRIFLDTGRDFSKKAYRHIELRSNPNRHFYALVKVFSKTPLKRLQLMLTFPKALVRINSLRLVMHDFTSPEAAQFTFFESSASSHFLECLSGKQIDFNTFYCDDHLKLIHTFANKGIYQLKIKFCCEKFSIQGDFWDKSVQFSSFTDHSK